MDGIHDLGGRHGFGAVEADGVGSEAEDVQFHEPWEARVRGMVTLMTAAPDWNVDWFRHCRELIDPVDYLSRPYFDQWAQAYSAMLVNSEWATVEEIANGKATTAIQGLKPPISAGQVHDHIVKPRKFDAEISAQPRFQVDDRVRTTTTVPLGHTRLPVYARGRNGNVIAYRGAHIFPDAMALNDEHYEHLYTIEFSCDELWPEANGSNDSVTLDLWESYLAAT